jgi:hypothetical protein
MNNFKTDNNQTLRGYQVLSEVQALPDLVDSLFQLPDANVDRIMISRAVHAAILNVFQMKNALIERRSIDSNGIQNDYPVCFNLLNEGEYILIAAFEFE